MKRSQKKALNRQQRPIQLKVNPDDLPDVLCECGNATFIQGKTIKKLSAILSSDGQVKYVNIAASICLKCFKALPLKP